MTAYRWIDCTECIFGSNSQKNADKHVDETGHDVVATREVNDE